MRVVVKKLHDQAARGQVANGDRMITIACTKQVSFVLAVQVNSSIKNQDSNTMFVMRSRKLRFGVRMVFTASVSYLIMFLFFSPFVSQLQKVAWKPNIILVNLCFTGYTFLNSCLKGRHQGLFRCGR